MPLRFKLVVRTSAALALLMLSTCSKKVVAPPIPPPPLQTAPDKQVNSDLAPNDKGGGCFPAGLTTQRAQQFNDVNPSWVPVFNGTTPNAVPVAVQGVVTSSHGDTGGDFPENHTSSDIVTDVQLDSAELGFVATGNGDHGTLALEWESAFLDSFAWPSVGDRIAAMGRWIFDCGHPNATPGHCSAATATQCVTDSDCSVAETCVDSHFSFNSEMHPPYAIAVSRLGRAGVVSDRAGATATSATRTDIFVSPNGGGADDLCVVTHIEDEGEFLLQHECYPLSKPLSANVFNKWDFEFDIPLPARPAGAAMSWHVVDRPTPGGTAAQAVFQSHLDGAAPLLHGSVKLTQAVGGKLPTGYAATVFAGWDVAPPAPLTHLRVTVDSVTIHNPLRPLKPVVKEVKDWALDARINGVAQRLTGLGAVNTGDVIPQSLVFDEYLPADGKLHLYSEGTAHSCVDTMFGQSFSTDIGQVGLGSLGDCLQATDADPGDVDVTYSGPDFGAGTGGMTYDSPSQMGQGGFCSATTATPCLTTTDCPSGENCNETGGAYSLHYKIERVP